MSPHQVFLHCNKTDMHLLFLLWWL